MFHNCILSWQESISAALPLINYKVISRYRKLVFIYMIFGAMIYAPIFIIGNSSWHTIAWKDWRDEGGNWRGQCNEATLCQPPSVARWGSQTTPSQFTAVINFPGY